MQPKLFSLIDKAAFDFDLFGDGRKILVGASGGKDSTLLLEYLSNRMKRRGTNFTVEAAYVKTDFAPEFNGELLSLVESWGIKVATIPVDTLARVKEGRKMNCWWCSTQSCVHGIFQARVLEWVAIALYSSIHNQTARS